jgi:hypothetical protein
MHGIPVSGQKEATMLDGIAILQATQLAADRAQSARPTRPRRPAGPRPRRRKTA